MDTQRAMNHIKKLENSEISGPQTAVLRELKKEWGLDPEKPAGDIGSLNVREMVEGAAATHALPERQPGFIKAYGLENRMYWSGDDYGTDKRDVNW